LQNSVDQYIKEGWFELACDVLTKLSISQLKLGMKKEYLQSYIKLMTFSKLFEIDSFFETVKVINETQSEDEIIEIDRKLIDLKFPFGEKDNYTQKLGDHFELNFEFKSNHQIDFDQVNFLFSNEKHEISIKRENVKIGDESKQVFSYKLDKIGLFELKGIQFRIGKIVLVLKKGIHLKILPSSPNLIITPSPKCLIVAKDQIIPLEIFVSGVVYLPKLTLKSKTGLIIYDKEPILSEMIENDSVKIEIKVKADSLTNCKHQLELSCSSYGKSKPQIEQIFEFNFHVPLTYSTFFKKLGNSTFVQYKLKNNLNVELKIEKSKLKMNESSQSKNGSVTLLEDETTCLLFKTNEMISQCSLHLEINVESQKLGYKIESVFKETTFKFQIELKLANEFQVGKFQTMELFIKSKQQENIESVVCEIEENDHWMINGTKKKKINLENAFKTLIAPIVCGYISIPKIKLQGVRDDEIEYIFERNRIFVIPENETTLGACFLDFK
jgi:hypothetical protein